MMALVLTKWLIDDDFENLLKFGFGDGVNNDSVFTHHLKILPILKCGDWNSALHVIKQHFYTNNY